MAVFSLDLAKSLDANNALNRMLLEEITALAAQTIHRLSIDSSGSIREWLAIDACAAAVIDLLCWNPVDSLDTDEDLVGMLHKKSPKGLVRKNLAKYPSYPVLL